IRLEFLVRYKGGSARTGVRNEPAVRPPSESCLSRLEELRLAVHPRHYVLIQANNLRIRGRHEKRLRRAGGPLGERISIHDLVPDTVEAHDTPFPTIVLEALPEPGTQVERVVPPMRLHEDVRVEHVQNRRLVPHSSASICSTNLSNVLPRSPVSMYASR